MCVVLSEAFPVLLGVGSVEEALDLSGVVPELDSVTETVVVWPVVRGVSDLDFVEAVVV